MAVSKAENKELSAKLVRLNDAVCPSKLDIIKLVAKHAFGIRQEDLDKADLLTSVYTLLEEKHGSSAFNILIMILKRLDVQLSLVDALKKHVKQNEIIIDGNLRMMDFILTVSCILWSLNNRKYLSLKELARRVVLSHFNSSNITSRTHLLQLLLEENCLTPNSFSCLFVWLEVVGCSLYHNNLKEYCRRYQVEVPEWKSLVAPLKEKYPNAGESKYNTHPRSCPRSFPVTESLPAVAVRDGGMIDSQSLSVQSKPATPFLSSRGQKPDLTPSPTTSYMYNDSTEHPVEASGPTLMVATARCVLNTNVVLVPGYQEKTSGVGNETNHQFHMENDDKTNDESRNSAELHLPESEMVSEEIQKEKLYVGKRPLSKLHVLQGNGSINNVPATKADDILLISTVDIDVSQIIRKNKERVCQRKCQICKLLAIIALMLCIGVVSGGMTYYYIGPSPGDTSVTLAQNATVNIGCFNLLHIGYFAISAIAQTSFKFFAVPSSSVVAKKIIFPVVSNKRAGTGYYISLNYYHIAFDYPLYSAGSGTLSYHINFTNFDCQESDISSYFHSYLYNSLDSYHEVLKNLGPARGFIDKFAFCPNSTNKVFNFTFPLPTAGFYYVAAFMPSNMNIDARISAEVPTYNITYLEGLSTLQSCLLDDGKCLLQVGHNSVHTHSEKICILASSSSDLYGGVIDGILTPQLYLFNAGSVSFFITGLILIIICPCIFYAINKICVFVKSNRSVYERLE